MTEETKVVDKNTDTMQPQEKRCIQCGFALTEEQLFCPKCGYKVDTTLEVNDNIKKFNEDFENKKRKKKKILKLCSILLSVIIAVALFVFLALPKIIESVFISKLDTAKANYVAETVNYDDTLEVISPYIRSKSEKVAGYAEEIKDDVQNLKTSRDKYSSAIAFLDKKDYESAYRDFDFVINEDSNYDMAQQLKNDNIANLKSQILSEINNLISKNNYSQATEKLNFLKKYCKDSDLNNKSTEISNAKKAYEAEQERKKIQGYKDNQKLVITSASTFNDGYYYVFRKARVSLKNKTNQVVRDATIVILQFDSNGYPIDAEYSMYQYGDVENSYKCGADSINLQAYGTWGSNNYWDIADDATKIKACVLQAEFYDGTTWTNPYFDYWIEQEKDRY